MEQSANVGTDYQNQTSSLLTCANCKAQLQEGELFCRKCGQKVCVTLGVNHAIEEYNAALMAKKHKKKIKRIVSIVSIVLVISILASVSYFFYFKPNSLYHQALDLMTEKKYEEAENIFISLGDFKDSIKQAIAAENAIKQQKYDHALDLCGKNDYAAAIEILLSISDYKDSNELISEIESSYYKNLQTVYANLLYLYDIDRDLCDCVAEFLSWDNEYSNYQIETTIKYLFEEDPLTRLQYLNDVILTDKFTSEFDDHLSCSKDYFTTLTSDAKNLESPPAEYKDIYNQFYNVYDAYCRYHNFLVNDSTTFEKRQYKKMKTSYEKLIDSENAKLIKMDSDIDDQAS